MMNCPHCGKLTDPKLENCLHCGGPVRVKAPREGAARGLAAHQCPNCKSSVQEGDIICVRCGTNLLTGQRISEEQTRERRAPWRPWARIAIGVMLATAAVAALGYTLYYLSQDPVSEAIRLSQNNNVLEAINVLQRHVAANPRRAEAQALLGRLHYQAQQFDKAAEALSEAARLQPDERDWALMAAAAAARLPGDEGRARLTALLREMLASRQANAQTLHLLALTLGAGGDYAGQAETLRKILEMDPNDAQARRDLGIALAMQGDFEGAEREIRAALQLHSEEADAVAVLGLLPQGDATTAEKVALLERALQSGVRVEPAIRARLGLFRIQEGDFAGALPLFRDAKADPASDGAFFYALCLQQSNLDTEALSEYDRIVTAGGPHAGEASIQMALIFLNQGNLQRALETTRRAAQLGAATARMYTVQGRIHLLENNINEAQQAFRNALQADPQYPAAHLENGLMLVGRGMMTEGLRELERYLELAGDDDVQGRRAEIELLVTQLRQTAGTDTRDAAQAATTRAAQEAVGR